MAYELIDAMRADRVSALDGGFDDSATGYRAGWDNRLATTLGAGAKATLVRNDNTVQITINWNDQRGEVVDDAGDASADADVGSLTFQTDI
jgi:type IV pilus assembly protein PilV